MPSNIGLMKKRRVCVIVQSYYLRDPRVRREAEALADAGYEVDVLTLKDKREPWKEVVNGVRIYRMPLSRKRASKARYIFEYAAFLLMAAVVQSVLHVRRRYDIVHVNNMPNSLVFSAILPKLFGAKVLLDVHDPMAELFISKYGLSENSLPIKFLRFDEKLSDSFADHIITVSEVMMDRLVKYGVPAEKIDVVLNVPDTRIFQPLKLENNSESQNDSFTMLFTGTVAERYGLDCTMRVVAKLQDKCPGLKLKIVGDGDHIPYLMELRDNLQADFVEFHPPVSITDIPVLASDCHATIQPQLRDCHTDLCFSTKVIESFAMGLPVIASATETMTRYFDDTQIVFFEPGNEEDLANAIQRLYFDKELRKSLAAEGLKLSSSLNWELEKPKFLSVIESMLSRKGVKEGAVVD